MTGGFDPTVFLRDPDWDLLAGASGVTVTKRDRKSDIFDALIKGLVDKGVMPKSHICAAGRGKGSAGTDAVKLKELEIEHERLFT
jgi:hypothetical protein